MADIPSPTVSVFPMAVQWTGIVLIAVFKATLLIVPAMLARRKAMRAVVLSALVLYCVLCAINGVVFALYDMGITIKLMTILLQTTANEVAEFVPSFVTAVADGLRCKWVYAVLAGICVLWILFIKCPRRILASVIMAGSVGGVLALVVTIASMSSGRSNYSIGARTVKVAVQAYKEHEYVTNILNRKYELPWKESVVSEHRANVVMVVGESASRDHLSLYGYTLPTSSLTDAMGTDSIIVFDDAIGSSTTTAANLSRVLTFLSDSDRAESWAESPFLISMLNEAGYETNWISNQDCSGTWGNSSIAMVSMADNVRYVGSVSSDDATLRRYDEVVVPEAAKVLSDTVFPKFTGIHLLGSHTEYALRYPEEFGRFDAKTVLEAFPGRNITSRQAHVVATYDNSICYTDYILSRIVGMVAASGQPAVLIYFSDHGENVYDDGDFCGRDERYVRVPFFIYANAAFRTAQPALWQQLRQSADRPFSTADISHLICTLTGTAYAAYDERKDVSSPSYVCDKRFVDDREWQYDK